MKPTIANRRNLFVTFRWLLVATQSATILTTWPLWNVRTSPPMLPVWNGPSVSFGLLLLASLAVILFRPRLGIILHAALLLVAMSLDQMRLQPEFISQAILLWGTLPSRTARTICRAHLIALWFFAGLHKLLSPGFYTGDAHWLVTSFFSDVSPTLTAFVGLVIAGSEITLAVMALLPTMRKNAVRLAYALHLGILCILMFGLHWDEAVWPWNLALAVAGQVMIGSWKGKLKLDFRRLKFVARAAVAFILIGPLAYYPGLLDTYLCHVLYSNHAPNAWIQHADDETSYIDTRPQLKVPDPQIHRLYEAHFQAVAQPGDRLEIFDPRLWYRWRRIDQRVITYENATAQPARAAN